jgi:AcrR family transcriptional regulator
MSEANTNEVSDRRESILRAAAKVFTERGYANATIDEVASHAGVAKGSVYTYFKSKQHLFQEVFTQHNPQHEAQLLTKLSAEPTAHGKMDLLFEAWYTRHASQPSRPLMMEFWQAAVRQDDGVLMDVFRRKYLFWRDMMTEILTDGIANGEFETEMPPAASAAILMAMFDGLLLQGMLNVGISLDRQTFDQLVAGIFDSLAPRTDR